ncbi:MAG: ABC-F family ATP-binding cassette domain-containing protein [Gammaproteobacteria bacterium]
MLSFNQMVLRRGERVLIDRASFTIHAGWKVGVTGPNGAGKSSLFALIRGELGADAGDFLRPEKIVIGHVAQESPRTDRPAIEYVLDGDAALRRIEAELAGHPGGEREAHLHAELDLIDGYGARHRAARLLDGLGFGPADIERPVNEFSGGWRIRLNLAQALMTRSDLLLLDEPTNHLDLDATLWLEDWLLRYDGTLLVISHDRDFLDNVIDHTLHVERGAARLAAGNYSAYEQRRAEELAQQQAAFRKQQREIAHMRAFVARFSAQATKARQAQSRVKALARMELIAAAHVDSPFEFAFPPPRRMSRPLVDVDRAGVGYDGRPVLQGLSFSLNPGDRIALLGRNGAGKSTLVKLIAGEIAPLAGTVTRAPDLAVGYFAQHQLEQLDPTRSALDFLAALEPGAAEQRLRDYLGGFGLGGDLATQPARTLSGGEKARAVLAAIVYRSPQLLLLDEPTNHLDMDMRQALAVALQDFGGAVIVVSHDRHLLRTVSDALWLVSGGRVGPFDGDLDDYRRWLLRGPEPDATGADAEPGGAQQRRDRRRAAAAERERLRPLTQEIARLEAEMERLAGERRTIETALADSGIYAPAERERLKALHQSQARNRAAAAAAEERWLQISAEIETLQVR